MKKQTDTMDHDELAEALKKAAIGHSKECAEALMAKLHDHLGEPDDDDDAPKGGAPGTEAVRKAHAFFSGNATTSPTRPGKDSAGQFTLPTVRPSEFRASNPRGKAS